MNIQPIVEGHGEVEAVPILLRRLRDLAEKCRSFRHLVKAFGELATAGGVPLAEWPPADWLETDA